MKKLFVFLIPFLGMMTDSFAQKITLDEALKMGLENRIEIKNQSLQVQIAENENNKVRAKWLPQLSGSADFRWNTQLQTTILPFDITGTNTGGTTQAQFGLPFNNTLGVQLDQKIFDVGQSIDRKINQVQIENQQNSLEQQKINVKQVITEAYYLVVFNQERIAFAEKQVERNQANLEAAETKWKAGTLLQDEYDRFVLDLSNAKISLQKAKQDLELSLEALKYQMGTKNNFTEVADKLANILKSMDNLTADMIAQRPEIKAEEIGFRLNELNAKKQRIKNLPSISAYGNYSALQLSNEFNPFKSGTWFPFNYVGLKVNIPIFDGGQARFSAKEFTIRQTINQNNVEKLKADFDYEAKNAFKQMTQARLDVEETLKNVSLAQQILATNQLRYDKGALTLSDLKNAEFSLQNAENNYLSSVYNFLVANVRYRKAVGSL